MQNFCGNCFSHELYFKTDGFLKRRLNEIRKKNMLSKCIIFPFRFVKAKVI